MQESSDISSCIARQRRALGETNKDKYEHGEAAAKAGKCLGVQTIVGLHGATHPAVDGQVKKEVRKQREFDEEIAALEFEKT